MFNSGVCRNHFYAKARVVRATEKRLKQLNKEITELIRQILELEEKYQINSKREVEAKLKEAVQTNDPQKLEEVLKPSQEVCPQFTQFFDRFRVACFRLCCERWFVSLNELGTPKCRWR